MAETRSLLPFVLAILSIYFIQFLTISKLTFFIFLLIISFIAGLLLLSIILFLLLDKLYRPNIPQYPFNVWLDRILPIIFLLSPSISILIYSPYEAWFSRLCLLIFIHIFILIPIFHYWSNLRRWDDRDTSKKVFVAINFNSWTHPSLYKHIAIAMIYPLIWGIYFSLSRFIRIGSTIDIYNKISFIDLDLITILLFISPHLLLWIMIPLSYFSKIRHKLWDYFSALLHSIHIFLLQYYPYFRFMELLFKFMFLVRSLLLLQGLVYYINSDDTFLKSDKKFRYFLTYLYYNNYWFPILSFISLILEIILTSKLYYGIYILFLYPFIHGILYCLFHFSYTSFVFDCCFSDYTRRNWINPKYPQQFWQYFQDAEYYFGLDFDFTSTEVYLITNEINKYKWKLRKKVSLRVHHDQLDTRINNPRNPFKKRLPVAYIYHNNVRWTHTEIIRKYHNATALFARSLWDRIVLINNSWKNISYIQRTPIIDTTPSNVYKYKQTFIYKRKHFIGVQEENIPSNFVPLIYEGVVVEPYDITDSEHKPVYFPQKNPDTIFNFKKGSFIDKRIHALDQKTNNPGMGRNKILSDITETRYESTLNFFEKELCLLTTITPEIKTALKQLKKTCNNLTEHQLVWAKYLHLFPDTHIPPLKIPQNFSYSQFTPEALREINRSELRMKKVSDYLYLKKVPQTNHGIFPKEALDLLEDTQIQQILKEDSIDMSLIVD